MAGPTFDVRIFPKVMNDLELNENEPPGQLGNRAVDVPAFYPLPPGSGFIVFVGQSGMSRSADTGRSVNEQIKGAP